MPLQFCIGLYKILCGSTQVCMSPILYVSVSVCLSRHLCHSLHCLAISAIAFTVSSRSHFGSKVKVQCARLMLMVTNPLLNKLRKVVKGKLPNPKTINEKLLMPFCRRVFKLVTKDERAAVEAGGISQNSLCRTGGLNGLHVTRRGFLQRQLPRLQQKRRGGTKHLLQGQPMILARPFGERRTSRRSSLR